jgi:hypothetical protein
MAVCYPAPDGESALTFRPLLSRNGSRGFEGETGARKAASAAFMVDEKLITMSEAEAFRERAARCRVMAKEYHPSVGAPLIELAARLEQDAAHLERSGVERRGKAMFG